MVKIGLRIFFVDKIVISLLQFRKEILTIARKSLRLVINENGKVILTNWIKNYTEKIQPKFSSHLFSQSEKAAINIKGENPIFNENSEDVDARIVLRDNFELKSNYIF